MKREQDARVTRVEAARIAGVSVRTISRWRSLGWLVAEYDPSFRRPATYSLREVKETAKGFGHLSLADMDKTDR